MAYNLFLSIPNIPGEATNPGFTNQIEVFSYSFGASNTETIGSGSTASGAGKASLSDLSFTKLLDASSPLLLEALFSGKNITPSGTAVTLSVVRNSGETENSPETFLVYTLKGGVFVNSVQQSGSTGGDSSPEESVSLTFAQFEETYRSQSSTGTLNRPTSVNFNRETNTTS